jgi:hypothetical protein
MTDVLVDSNIILDVLTEDPNWFEWSSRMLAEYANQRTGFVIYRSHDDVLLYEL